MHSPNTKILVLLTISTMIFTIIFNTELALGRPNHKHAHSHGAMAKKTDEAKGPSSESLPPKMEHEPGTDPEHQHSLEPSPNHQNASPSTEEEEMGGVAHSGTEASRDSLMAHKPAGGHEPSSADPESQWYHLLSHAAFGFKHCTPNGELRSETGRAQIYAFNTLFRVGLSLTCPEAETVDPEFTILRFFQLHPVQIKHPDGEERDCGAHGTTTHMDHHHPGNGTGEAEEHKEDGKTKETEHSVAPGEHNDAEKGKEGNEEKPEEEKKVQGSHPEQHDEGGKGKEEKEAPKDEANHMENAHKTKRSIDVAEHNKAKVGEENPHEMKKMGGGHSEDVHAPSEVSTATHPSQILMNSPSDNLKAKMFGPSLCPSMAKELGISEKTWVSLIQLSAVIIEHAQRASMDEPSLKAIVQGVLNQSPTLKERLAMIARTVVPECAKPREGTFAKVHPMPDHHQMDKAEAGALEAGHPTPSKPAEEHGANEEEGKGQKAEDKEAEAHFDDHHQEASGGNGDAEKTPKEGEEKHVAESGKEEGNGEKKHGEK